MALSITYTDIGPIVLSLLGLLFFVIFYELTLSLYAKITSSKSIEEPTEINPRATGDALTQSIIELRARNQESLSAAYHQWLLHTTDRIRADLEFELTQLIRNLENPNILPKWVFTYGRNSLTLRTASFPHALRAYREHCCGYIERLCGAYGLEVFVSFQARTVNDSYFVLRIRFPDVALGNVDLDDDAESQDRFLEGEEE